MSSDKLRSKSHTTTQSGLVLPSHIENELSRIRNQAIDLDKKLVGAGISRARVVLSNTVILLPADHNSVPAKLLHGAITDLCIAYPSRFFIIRYDEDFDNRV